MRSFSTASSYKEKQTNWEYLKKLFKKFNQLALNDDVINQIINEAPNAAFDFLCVLFKFLTKKEYNIIFK
jgi:hypothetical protein